MKPEIMAFCMPYLLKLCLAHERFAPDQLPACVKDPCCMSRSLRHRTKPTRTKVWSFEPQHQHHDAPVPMIRICARATFRSRTTPTRTLCLSTQWLAQRQFSSTAWRREDPRIESMGREIIDEFAVIREEYGKCIAPSCKVYTNTT